MRRRFLSALAAFAAASASVIACPGTHPLYGEFWWTPDCQNPTIVVTGDATNNTTFTGNNIQIEATSGPFTPGVAHIGIQGAQSGLDVGDITISSVGSLTVVLSFDISIRNVGSIKISPAPGNGVKNLWIEGQIFGNLGEVIATGIGVNPSGLGFEVNGDLNGNVLLKDTEIAPDLRTRSFVVRGSIAQNLTIDVESGGIGTIQVDGVIGAPSNPVLIRSGRDITKLTAGEMHVNIVAGWDDPNNPNDPTEWANVEKIQVLLDTGNETQHTGDFVGTIYANTIGEPIKRAGDPEGAQSIPQIEVQGDFQGILSFESPIVPHHTFTGPQIIVRGDFLSNSIIQLPENGLVGQIILNGGDEDGIWQTTPPNGARVNVGDPNGPGPSYSLTGPSYGFLASSLGGGAAGHAAFRVHRLSPHCLTRRNGSSEKTPLPGHHKIGIDSPLFLG